MSALVPSDEPYMKTGIFMQVRNRIGWLLFLMLSATITEHIISGFENKLAIMSVLYPFMPMITGTGGNAGSQASTLVIRGLALNEIQLKDALNVLWRETRVGIICGIILAVVNFIRIYLTNGQDALLSLAIALSLIATIVIAKSVGCLLPIAAKKIKLDPAVMASPLIATIVDGTSLLVFFTIARIIFK
jgi:magnesium transporter